ADRLILLRGRRRAPMHAVLVPQLHKAQALAQLERQDEAHALLDAVQKAATADDDSAIVYRAVAMRLNQDLVRARFTEAGGIHERALALASGSGQSAQRVGAIHAELVSALIASLYARSPDSESKHHAPLEEDDARTLWEACTVHLLAAVALLCV